jgi:hypothetical protein
MIRVTTKGTPCSTHTCATAAPSISTHFRSEIAALSASLITGIQQNPDVPAQVKQSATVTLAPGAPFISDSQLRTSLEASGVPAGTIDAVTSENRHARIDGLDAALGALALLAVIALFFTGRLPNSSRL